MKRHVALFLICVAVCLFFGCQGTGDDPIDSGITKQDSNDFTTDQVKRIVNTLNLNPGAVFFRSLDMPAYSFYRLEVTNPSGGQRLGTIVSYEQAASTTFGIEDTAKVLLFDAMTQKAGYSLDFFAFVQALPAEALAAVSMAIVQQFGDVEFVAKSSQPLAKGPLVAPILDDVLRRLPLPSKADWVATPLNQASFTMLLIPKFPQIDPALALRLWFTDEMQRMTGALVQNELSEVDFFKSNVVPLSRSQRKQIRSKTVESEIPETGRCGGRMVIERWNIALFSATGSPTIQIASGAVSPVKSLVRETGNGVELQVFYDGKTQAKVNWNGTMVMQQVRTRWQTTTCGCDGPVAEYEWFKWKLGPGKESFSIAEPMASPTVTVLQCEVVSDGRGIASFPASAGSSQTQFLPMAPGAVATLSCYMSAPPLSDGALALLASQAIDRLIATYSDPIDLSSFLDPEGIPLSWGALGTIPWDDGSRWPSDLNINSRADWVKAFGNPIPPRILTGLQEFRSTRLLVYQTQFTNSSLFFMSGIASGAFNTPQTLTLTPRPGISLEYSLDGGTTWNSYTGPVSLTTEGSYTIFARQVGGSAAPEGGFRVIIDRIAPAAPTVSGIASGSFSTTQTFTVTGAESGGTLHYSLDNGTTWATYTAAVALGTNGTSVVTARQIDAAGNIGDRSPVITVVIDKTAPAAPTVSGIATGSFATTQTFTLTAAKSGGSLQYSLDNGSTWATYTVAVSLASEGTSIVTSRQIDGSGNTSDRSPGITVVIDKTAPVAPNVAGIATGSFSTTQTFTVTGAESGGSLQYSLDNGTTWATYTAAVSLITDGISIVTARQIDAAGNTGARSAGITVTVDKIAPAAPTVSGIATGSFTTTQTFTVTSAESGGTLQYSLDNGTTWVTYAAAVSLATDGTSIVTARQIDLAGNASARSAGITVVIDAAAPAAPTVSGIATGSFTTTQTFTVTGAESGGSLQYSLDNGTSWATYTATVSLATDGTSIVTARQIDAAGNIGARSAGITVVVDKIGPTWTSGFPVSGTSGGFSGQVGFSSAEIASVSWVLLPSGAAAPSAAQVRAGTNAAGGLPLASGGLALAASIVATASLGGLASGTTYDLYAVVADGLGNLTGATKVTFTTASSAAMVQGTANWNARYRINGVTFNNRIWVVGGGDGALNPACKSDAWSSSDGITWTDATAGSIATFPSREGHGITTFNSKLWVAGGRLNGTGTYTRDVWSSSDGGTWTVATTTAAFSPRYRHALLPYQPAAGTEKLYLLGGNDDSPRNDVFSSSDGITWTSLGNAGWSARDGFACAAFQGKIYVMGGNDGTALSDVWTYDGTSWNQVPGVPGWAPRRWFSACVFDNKLWIFGGRNAAYVFQNDLWYTADGVSWSQVTTTVPARSECGFVTNGQRLFIFGGLSSGGQLNDVWGF